MLSQILICSLFAQSVAQLFDKWDVDNVMKTSNRWAKYWPKEICQLCFKFWFAVFALIMLKFVPFVDYVIIPVSTIALYQVFGRFMDFYRRYANN